MVVVPLPPLRFNPATVQSADDPASFVTYHDAQAYPAYIIEFKDTHLGGLTKVMEWNAMECKDTHLGGLTNGMQWTAMDCNGM